MDQEDFESQISGIAALNDPVRRALYRYVVGRSGDVSRDEAAQAVGVQRALAAFHLDKLADEGLLDVDYRRLSGRRGPGAGRPSKLYRRSERRIELSLPPRRHELVARLMAQAIEEERRGSRTLAEALERAAADFGAALGAEARRRSGPRPSRQRLLESAQAVLGDYGFEPRWQAGEETVLGNCPFAPLSAEHADVVCAMNLALVRGLVGALGAPRVEAQLAPTPGRCCVKVVRSAEGSTEQPPSPSAGS